MVERRQPEENKQAEKFPESVNAPVMARMNLSNVFLDPEIGQAWT